jgi:hypothetical protein
MCVCVHVCVRVCVCVCVCVCAIALDVQHFGWAQYLRYKVQQRVVKWLSLHLKLILSSAK